MILIRLNSVNLIFDGMEIHHEFCMISFSLMFICFIDKYECVPNRSALLLILRLLLRFVLIFFFNKCPKYYFSACLLSRG